MHLKSAKIRTETGYVGDHFFKFFITHLNDTFLKIINVSLTLNIYREKHAHF